MRVFAELGGVAAEAEVPGDEGEAEDSGRNAEDAPEHEEHNPRRLVLRLLLWAKKSVPLVTWQAYTSGSLPDHTPAERLTDW